MLKTGISQLEEELDAEARRSLSDRRGFYFHRPKQTCWEWGEGVANYTVKRNAQLYSIVQLSNMEIFSY